MKRLIVYIYDKNLIIHKLSNIPIEYDAIVVTPKYEICDIFSQNIYMIISIVSTIQTKEVKPHKRK